MLLCALQICKSIVPNLNLTEICKDLTSLQAYKAVIDLCTYFGSKVDVHKVAENFYNAGDNSGDQEGFGYYQKR